MTTSRHAVLLTWLAVMSVSTTRLGAQETPVNGLTSPVVLHANWKIKSAANLAGAGGESISVVGFPTDGWYAATVPTTVVAALVAAKVYPDPDFGMNLRQLPGETYPIGRNFANLPMPDNSPFRVSWWYRTTFALPASMAGTRLALHFDGINYRANVWLNGVRIAPSDSVAGMFRLYEFDVSKVARTDRTNVLAVEVMPPQVEDLALTWVDWNPAPPDKDMGIWRPVYVTASGPVVLRYPQVISRVDTATLARADLTVSVEARNESAEPVVGTVQGEIAGASFSQSVSLSPHESKLVQFAPDQFPQLTLVNPRLWWPAGVGPGTPSLYDLHLSLRTNGQTSDRQSVRFGIREITSEMTPDGRRLFRVNGRRILIRGGGWAPDMLLRADPVRQEEEIQYVRDLRLNTIRLEGKLEDEHFFDLTDRYGVLVLAGWSCCDQWEQWKKWTREDTLVAAQSQRDQIRRLRNRPSILAWLNGSDNPPPAAVESTYVSILNEYHWPNPVLSSASGTRAQYSGPSGVKMSGPYDWVPPSYWLLDATHGGAFGFNTETSPGAAVPPAESIRRMLPDADWWPIDSAWNFHAGGGQFANLKTFTDALTARYGAPSGLDDYAEKSQLMTYESERAMFEAYTRNRYSATGVIQWMLENGWPSMIWHLYDYYLRPGGGYFGAKKALEPVHVMYSYDDRSIAVINQTGQSLPGARVAIRVLGLDLASLYRRDTAVDIPADSVLRLAAIPIPQGVSGAYLVDLRLTSADGKAVSSNVYWLSTKDDEMDLAKSTWYGTPLRSPADFTALASLPLASVTPSVSFERTGSDEVAHVTLTNTGHALAFFVRMQITGGAGGTEVLPVRWEDNYVTLLPGESRDLSATFSAASLKGARAALTISGWNLQRRGP